MRCARTFAILALTTACASTPAPPDAFSFALIGDAPYRTSDEARFATMLERINDDRSLHFVLHAGDIKSGHEPCTEALLRRRLAQFDAVRTALVYTPGDNEWTDCHRPAAGRFHPLERLETLRRLAFAQPRRSFGQQPITLQSQADDEFHGEFVENAVFVHRRVLFVTLHVVGSNNALRPWHGIDRSDRTDSPRPERMAAFQRRQAANLAWMQFAFSQARAIGALGAVVLMQANPRFEIAPGHRERAGFDVVIDELRRLVLDFGRPVLLVHGDRHLYFNDWPLAADVPPVPNLQRVQTYGHPWTLWVRIDVDPSRKPLFDVRPGEPTGNEPKVSARLLDVQTPVGTD